MIPSYRNILLLLSVAMVVLNTLPIMSVYSGGGESCTLMVRGYNLIEFSPWSAIPIFTAVIVLGILFSFQERSAKHAELLLLLATNIVCYVESFGAARTWLESVGSSVINCHFGMVAFPVATVGVIIFAIVLCAKNSKYHLANYH
ncbi:MAG: hypothetical protein IJ376_04450 [Acidaminococcaceae bacterium]|nr:hypothetical protein [Acidaminococcaceae bacterium]